MTCFLIQNTSMKKPIPVVICLSIVVALSLSTTAIIAQTETVTLVASNTVPSSFDCGTNQVVTIHSFISSIGGQESRATISFDNGMKIVIGSHRYGQVTSTESSMAAFQAAVFTGVTNIAVTTLFGPIPSVSALTFTVTTPAAQSLIPANAVVIPSDVTGPVQIVLESSSDLLNWTSALPGTYGSTYSNRFFRVRAIAD